MLKKKNLKSKKLIKIGCQTNFYQSAKPEIVLKTCYPCGVSGIWVEVMVWGGVRGSLDGR